MNRFVGPMIAISLHMRPSELPSLTEPAGPKQLPNSTACDRHFLEIRRVAREFPALSINASYTRTKWHFPDNE